MLPRQFTAHWVKTTSACEWRGDMFPAQRQPHERSAPHEASQAAVAAHDCWPCGWTPLHTDARTQEAAELQSFARCAQAMTRVLLRQPETQVWSAYIPQRESMRQPSAHACASLR